MKKIALVLSMMFFIAFAASSQTAAKPATTPKASGPEISFESLEHDYGTVVQGSDGDCVFKFKNSGNEPLILSDVRKSCGCTTPTLSKEPILPGQKGEIKVGYNTNIVGSFSKTITVLSNATNASVTLVIKGTVTVKETQQ